MGNAPHQRRLGEILVDTGVLSEDDLALVLAEHQRSGRMVGELVISLGLATSRAITDALAHQKGWGNDDIHGLEERLSSDGAAPAAAAAPEPPRLQDTGVEPADHEAPDSFHRLFFLTAKGYEMVTRGGPAPAQGTVVEIESGGMPVYYEVVKHGRSVLPDRACPCAYLQQLPAGART